jgi:PAS domain S-box-containing protein
MPDSPPDPYKQLHNQIQKLKAENAALKQDAFQAGLSVQLRAILDNIPIRAFWKNNQCVYKGANAAFLHDAGLSSNNDIIGKTDFDLPWTRQQASQFQKDDRSIMESGKPELNIEEQQTRSDGITGWLKTSKIPLKDEHGHVYGILGTYEDITDQKLQQQALEASEQRFKALYNQTSQFIGLLSPVGNLIATNDAFKKRFGLADEDIAGQYLADTDFWSHDQHQRDQMVNAINQAIQGHSTRFTFTTIAADNQLIYVDSSLKPMLNARGDVEMLLIEGNEITQSINDQKRLQKAEQQLRELNETLEQRVEKRTQQLEASNQILSHTLDRLNQTQTELVQSEKMASLGSLVSGFSHEVNTPIGIAVTASSLVSDELNTLVNLYQNGTMARSHLESFFEKADEGLQMLVKNLNRASELIGSFKQVAVDQASEALRTVNLSHYLQEVIRSLQPRIKRARVEVTIKAHEELNLTTYPGSIAQILTNLVINSITHAFEQTATPKILICVENSTTSDSVKLIYQDNGCGMSEEISKHIFDPFFTTRRDEGGSGLGMNIVYKLITQKLNGKISCNTSQNNGTRFEIILPVQLRPPEDQNDLLTRQ